jgi:hypothetical protein
MKGTLTQTKDIAAEFALASKNNDIGLLKKLLSKDGSFHIQSPSLDTIEVQREEFLEWYKKKLDATTIESIEYDQCLLCLLGKPVVLFNNGKFPRQVKDSSERAKTGLVLNIRDSKIIEMGFCYTFLRTENKNVFETTGEKIGKYIEAGIPKKEAITKAIADESREFNLVQGKWKL